MKVPVPMPEEPQEVHVVNLVTADARCVPIWIGSYEGEALKMQLEGIKTQRPMTYDLMLQALDRAGARVVAADVLRIEDSTFIARLTMLSNGREETFDCRPSDALNLALRAGATITVAHEVLDDDALEECADTV